MNVSAADALVEQNKTQLLFLPMFQITTSCNRANISKKTKQKKPRCNSCVIHIQTQYHF